MPIYEFDLSDGTTLTVESETEPTDEQVLGALQTQEVPVQEPRFTQNLGQVLSAPQPELPPQTIPYTGIQESMAPMVDWERFQAGPTFAEERTTGVPSAAGLTPEVVPSGRAVSEVMQGIPATSLPFEPLRGVLASEIPATLTSSVAKTGIGLAEYLSSPQGVTEFVASMTPAKLLVLGKWAVDMAKGAGQEAGALSALLGKPNKTRDDWQAISDHAVNTAAMVFGAGATARGVARPVTRALTPAKVKAAQELSRLLETTEPMGTVQPSIPIRQLGIPQAALTAEPFLQPGIPELAVQALREAQSPLTVPGRTPAIEMLRRELVPPQVTPIEPTRVAERIPGGGEAPYGKVSYMRPAEAPTTERTQVAMAEPLPIPPEVQAAGKKAEAPVAPAKAPPVVPEFTPEQAESKGYTIRAYRGVSKSKPFNESGTVWLTTNKDVAEVYAKETFGYEDAAVIEVFVNPKDIPTYNIRKLSQDELSKLEPDASGNPQKIGIYEHSDDSLLGSGYPQTAIHVPMDRIAIAKGAKTEAPPAEPPGAPLEKVVELVKDPTRMDGVLRSKAGDVTLRAPVSEHPDGGYVVNEITAFVQPGVLENVFKNRPQVTIQVTEPIRAKTAQEARNLAYEKFAEEINTGKFEISSEVAPDLISKLESLKLPETGEGTLYSLPHPDAIKTIGRSTWNTAIDVAIASIKAGKAIAQAVDDAIAYLRKNVRGLDETRARANLEYVTREETRPAAAPTPERGETPAAATESPEATRPVVDPITGEPGKVITEAAAKRMEAKVKLPAQVDVEKLATQIDLFNKEIGDALETGGQFLPKEMRPEVAKGAPAERKTVTNKEINQYFVNKLSSIRKQMQATKQRIAQQADVESQVYFDTLQKRFETAFRQVQELRRASHEALYFWNKIRAEYQDIARAAGAMPEMKRQLPILDQVWKDVREGDYRQGGRHFIDFLRMNLFTLGSWTLDFGTNLVATTTKIPAWAIMDVASFVSGNPATRMMSATRALADNMKNWIPFGRRFRLPDQIESELGTTAGGEFGGKGREVIVDFSEILRTKPELADKLRHLDKLLGAPVRMKRAVDSFFGRFGATAELYNRAYQEGRTRGLKGDELKQFAEEYVQKPPDATIARAVKTGKELKFNRDLSRFEESFSSNLGIKVFVEAFPRWTMQFMRWGGEMIGVDPVFFKDLVTGKATAEQTVTYLTKAATGWGGIYAFNQLFYDNIDANSMEYVKEDGDRVRLAGRTPAPELFFISALLRGDTQKAKAALAHLSLPGAKLLSGEPAGLISPLVDTIRESIRGRYTAEQTARELSNLVNNAIPGKSVLGLIRSLYDPTIRQGIGAPIPGVASLLPQRINPTTGEPLAPKQKIPGTKFEIPTVGGTPFPGATRVLNDIESALLNHGLGLTRPRRTSIIDLPAEDVPKKVRQEYEISVGKYVKEFVGGVITEPEFKSMEFEDRREVLKQLLEAARLNAKADLSDKYGTSMAPVPSLPLNIERMPERLRK